MTPAGRRLLPVVLAGWWLVASGTTPAAAQHAPPEVIWTPPTLTVRARDANLPALLSEIGARAGFTVVADQQTRPPVSISVEGRTLDDVLRLLLRGEDHAIVYRDRGGRVVVDSVLLRGPRNDRRPSAVVAAPTPPVPPVTITPGLPVPPGAIAPATGSVPAPTPSVASPGAPSAPPAEAPTTGASVNDLLERRAVGAIPVPAAPQPPQPPAPPASADPDSALAATSRQAQQNLKTLMQGLKTATDSLLGNGTGR